MDTYKLALDTGGTFTDVILVRSRGGALWTTKTPSTPHDPSEAFITGVRKMLDHADVAPEALELVFHGSTVATNAVLEGKGATTGMIVTRGTKYVLEIGRHNIPRAANPFSWIKPARPVPPYRIMEVPERMSVDGSVLQALDEAACREAARRLLAIGVESIAIVFLHSYANPAHERRAAELVREEFPDVPVSISSEVLPVFREYERAMVTVLNAFIQPVVSRYIGKLENGLRTDGVGAPLLIMKSNGGLVTPGMVDRQAINLALSGPAAGAIAAAYVGRLTNHLNVVSIDIGGTSADVCLIREGRPGTTSDGEIGSYPLQTPIVDITSIGAGGGSIAAVTGQGSLIVGPQSAGAAPGPACYGQGGQYPTVTDANLVLGRIPDHLLGGEFKLYPELARKAIHDRIAKPLGIDVVRAAEGILQIVNNNMVGALRLVSVEKGHDPRQFALMAFGGAGPLMGGELAALLGTPTMIVPRFPGIMCALGLQATDLRNDYVQTCVQRAGRFDLAAMEGVFVKLTAEADAHLSASGVAAERRRFQRLADLRYVMQGFELTVEFRGAALTQASVDRLTADFHELHKQLYTFSRPEAPVEITTLRLRAIGLVDKIELPRIATAEGAARAVSAGNRPVHFAELGFVETPVYERTALRAGQVVAGPAIVDQLDATTVVFPGHRARVEEFGDLVVQLGR
ncbi:MAG: hydantoinase/oxoprolinase family protein [Candidatus Lambdaproteobacteria bacterium]|nr:hydantoinase/oxoprolinase family protein [Candidatus Lambdaproteobacteria bacterium]